jgi:uncharacterized membrane protein
VQHLLECVYIVTGLMLWCFAALTVMDRTHPHPRATGLFWFLLGTIFAGGRVLPHSASGLLVLVMVFLDGLGWVACKAWPALPAPMADGSPLGGRIFLPVLVIPLATAAGAVGFRSAGLDSGQGAVLGMGLGAVVGAMLIVRLSGDGPRVLLEEGRRINEVMGAVSILPQLLASLGAVFVATRLGDLIAAGIRHVLPADNLFLLITANCCGMATLTLLLGNSFAAFPIIASGVTVPLIIKPFGVNPALAGILTLTAGASGTLMTPMAANFNLIPAGLLNMRNPYGVIRAQAPTALALLAYHIVLMWLLVRLGR